MIHRYKLHSLAYISLQKVLMYLQPLYVIRPKATEFCEITLQLGLLCRSRSSKVTEFGTNRKHIYNFLLVINTNVAPLLSRFRDIAFDKSKIAIFVHPARA